MPALKTLQIPSEAGISAERDLHPPAAKGENAGEYGAHLLQMVAGMPTQGGEDLGVPPEHGDSPGWKSLRGAAVAPGLRFNRWMLLKFPGQLGHPDLQTPADVTEAGRDAGDPEVAFVGDGWRGGHR